MAPRRLVAVLIVLLILATALALVLPAPKRPARTDSTPSPPAATNTQARRPGPSQGEVVTAAITAGQEPRRRRLPRIRLAVGDELRLRVRSTRPDEAELRGFGLIEPVARNAPALFDAFAERAGRFPVRLVDARRTIGTIVVERSRENRSRGARN